MPFGTYFGAMSKPLAEQIKDQGLTVVSTFKLRHLQRDADAITRLQVRGILSQTATHAARKKLHKAIAAIIKPTRSKQ